MKHSLKSVVYKYHLSVPQSSKIHIPHPQHTQSPPSSPTPEFQIQIQESSPTLATHPIDPQTTRQCVSLSQSTPFMRFPPIRIYLGPRPTHTPIHPELAAAGPTHLQTLFPKIGPTHELLEQCLRRRGVRVGARDGETWLVEGRSLDGMGWVGLGTTYFVHGRWSIVECSTHQCAEKDGKLWID